MLALFPMFVFMNCSSTKTEPRTSTNTSGESLKYFQETSVVELEVHYEAGAEPFVGNTLQGRPYWGVLQENLAAIFQYRSAPPTLNVPKTLAEMHDMGVFGRTEWTSADILALHAYAKLGEPAGGAARFYIYFVKGNYADAGGKQTGVIGVSIGGTPVIAIFKEVIQTNVANPNGPAAKFIEQSTLVHEMGHALGFVDSGVPMASNHLDAAHPGHTTNTNCVMYWLNEGVTDLQAFIQQFLVSNSVVMWGPEVLKDAQALSR